MSDHAPGDATQGHDMTDHPTTQFRPYQQVAGADDTPAGTPAVNPDTGSFNRQADAGEGTETSATRSFGGFRTERRFSEPLDPWPSPGETQAQQQQWNPGPATWVPQPMENPAPVYYGGAPSGGNAPYRPAEPIAPFSDLSTTSLLRQVKPPPTSGWRRLLYVLSGQLINVGESPRTARYNDLVVQVNRPLQGCHRIAVLSLKGGVGKTTITATLGATFASIRGDRVVAVDANPDRGTLSQKVPMETPATVRHLLRDADGIQRYSDVRSYTNQGPSRLEVLASESDPAVSEAFSAEDYARTLQVLERFYSLVLTDCGTGLMHSAMSAVLAKADTMIVVSSGSVDGARSASATLDWLDAHGHEELVRNSIAVINAVRPRGGKVDMQKVVDHFSRRCRAVRLVPFDPHLEEGAEIDLLRLKRDTREALVELAAIVAEAFPGDDRFNQHFV
ncbi:MinD/ParA family protein [Mycolicibacter terrae]|uniref:MinD/ParA family protein n=1 Tax=Mycolicibacter terrae TaxID=1788 RepID=A0ACD2EHI4_9MYCO|nr:MinD/ParA family protein [Mycolicibacter terrae]RRR40036.1 MinD/ParA family protein [Mycolicibacter terrae]